MLRLAIMERVQQTLAALDKRMHGRIGRRISKAVEDVSGWYFDRVLETYRCNGMEFQIPLHATSRPFRSRFVLGTHEWSERILVERHLSADASVLEIGGGFGVVACLANKRLADPAAHVVVDADPRAIEVLTANRDRNNCHFEILHGIIGDSGSTANFYLRDNVLGSGLCRVSKDAIEVHAFSLRDIEQRSNVRFDTYIVDIEGGECAFIEQNMHHLSNARLIIVEFHEKIVGLNAIQKTQDLLKTNGFSLIEGLDEVEAWSSN